MRAGRSEKGAGRKGKALCWLAAAAAVSAAAYAAANRQKPGPCIPAGGPAARVLLKDEENLSGLGLIMSTLAGKLLEDPEKSRLLDGMSLVVAIEPMEQPETAITMSFSDGYIVFEPGVVESPDVKIKCNYEVLMQVAGMGYGIDALKFLASPEGREIVEKFFSGELVIEGMLAHPLGLLRFVRFLAPTEA